MKITRACDYTIRALVYMAQEPVGTVFMKSDIAKVCSIPDSFLAKIFQNLAKSDILSSERGKKGGFTLGKEPANINMYDVITLVDGPITMNNCLDENIGCAFDSSCLAHVMWADIQNTIAEKLKNYTLKDISEPCKNKLK